MASPRDPDDTSPRNDAEGWNDSARTEGTGGPDDAGVRDSAAPTSPLYPQQPYPAPGYGPPGYQSAGYPPAGYPPGAYPQPYPAPVRGTNTMAILALVLAFLFPPAGIVVGHIAKRQIRQTGEEGGTLATVGLVLSYVFTGLVLLFCCMGIIAAVSSGTSTS